MRGLGGRAARALYVHRRGISDTTQEILSLEVVPLKGGRSISVAFVLAPASQPMPQWQ